MTEKNKKYFLESPWLTLPEAAKRARVSIATLMRYRSQGRLKVSGTVGKGGVSLIYIDHLDTQIANNWQLLDGAQNIDKLEPVNRKLLVPSLATEALIKKPDRPLQVSVVPPSHRKH